MNRFASPFALCLFLVAGCGSGGGFYGNPIQDLAMAAQGADLAQPPVVQDLAQPPVVQDLAQPNQPIFDLAVGPSCNDNQQNGSETDVDCGGAKCGPCAVAQKCAQNTDCITNMCSAGRCQQAMVQTAPVGGACGKSADCSGPNPTCDKMVGKLATANGYCTNAPCQNNNDCGFQGFCPIADGVNYCLGACQDKNQCQKINPDNRCFYWNGQTDVCLPKAQSQCDPTSGGACNLSGDCLRQGPDSVGICLTSCTFNAACPADGQGNAQNCYFFNQKVDVNGQPTGDVFQGLACYTTSDLGLGEACNFLNDCGAGLECNFFQVGGPKVCKQLCRSGGNDCSMGGACQDAFKLGPKFMFGAVGLCL